MGFRLCLDRGSCFVLLFTMQCELRRRYLSPGRRWMAYKQTMFFLVLMSLAAGACGLGDSGDFFVASSDEARAKISKVLSAFCRCVLTVSLCRCARKFRPDQTKAK